MTDEERAKWVAERIYEEQDYVCGSDDIEVAARHVAAVILAVRAEEREAERSACAKVASDRAIRHRGTREARTDLAGEAEDIAAAIRARRSA